MSMTLSGNGTITGLVSGGLPDGTVLPADLSTGGPYWDTSGNLLVGKTSATANGGDVQVSKGITFPATQIACSDTNTLDDYEEGTWTPVPSALSGSITSYASNGKYTKIGRSVICSCYIYIINNGSGSTAGIISGLPFATSIGATACTRDFAGTGIISVWQAGDSATEGIMIATGSTTYPWASGTQFNLSFCYQI